MLKQKNIFGDLLEITGGTTMLATIMVDIMHSFWFFCGGVAFLVGAWIKYKEYLDKKEDRAE